MTGARSFSCQPEEESAKWRPFGVGEPGFGVERACVQGKKSLCFWEKT